MNTYPWGESSRQSFFDPKREDGIRYIVREGKQRNGISTRFVLQLRHALDSVVNAPPLPHNKPCP